MKALTMWIALSVAWNALCCTAQPADVAVVKGTIAVKKDPTHARAHAMYFDSVAKKLAQSGIPFDTLSDEQVIAGKLGACKVAIFPFNTVSQADEIKQVLAFVQGGGKLVWFYSFPRELGAVLGIDKHSYRGKNRDGEFFSMKFVDDRPPGFPKEVHQESPNCRIVEKVSKGSRAIAVWHDKLGKSTGIPAVVLSPDSVYVAHVFWSEADADQQAHLLLAAIGHFLPQKWTEIVDGALRRAAPDAGFEQLDQLSRAGQKNPVARQWADQAAAQAREAGQRLAAKDCGEALKLARQARTSAQNAATALFPSRPYELRGAWVHPNDATDWEAIMSELQAAQFNAVFPLMCGPESAKYPSAYAPQLTRRDHMKECLDAARRHGIEVHVWKANWQVLDSAKERCQKFADEKRFVLSLEQAIGKEEKSSYRWSTRWLDPSEERNRQLEFDMMIELVEKYHPHGIHFDFMRYPESSYCYCDRCRTEFQKWAAIRVAQWPQDCAGKGAHAEKFRDWRRHLQTSLVKRIAEGARRIDPNVKLSLAARASMTGSYESDAQDWVTWSKEGYLDFLCPMNYTDRVEVLRNKLQPQVAAVRGAVPIYAGLGVSPVRSATPVNLSQQIQLARELGADGFLVFALSPFSRAMLPTVRLGPTSAPVTLMPHHKQPVRAVFEYPPGIAGAPERTCLVRKDLAVKVRVAATGKDVKRITARAFRLLAAGGNEEPAAAETQGAGEGMTLTVNLAGTTGVYVIVVRGEATFGDGSRKTYYLRSLPIRIVSQDAATIGGAASKGHTQQ